MRVLTFLLFLQAAVPPQREIIGPYTFREDQGQTTKVILKNGLTIIVREEHAVPLVSITTYVKAGSFNEDDRVIGVSQVIDHIMFIGKPSEDMRSLGGILSSKTYGDRTIYNSVVPAANATAALAIQSSVLRHTAFESADVQRGIERVLQENITQQDSPSNVADQRLQETAFAAHRIKRAQARNPEALRALTSDDVLVHYQKYYRPGNSILTVVGAADREKILEESVRLYGNMENVAADRDASPPEPAQDTLRYAWRRGAIQQAHVALGFHGPGIFADDTRSLEVIAAILGSGRASRLNQILRNQKGLITEGSARVRTFADFGYLEIDLVTPSPLDAATAVLAEVANIRRTVSDEALARAKLALAQDYYRRLETVQGVSNDLAYYEAQGDWKRSSSYLADIQRVTSQRVMDAAGKYLTFDNLSVFEYLPESAERYFSTGEYRAAVLNKVEGAVERRNETELPVVQIPTRNGIITDSVGTIQRRSILRGPEVHILEDHRLPIVSFGLFFPGGRLLETERNAGITELMLRAALRGAGNWSSSDIARRIENAGTGIEIVNEPDFFGYMVNGFPGRVDQALKVLIDVTQNPLFDEGQVTAERTIQLAQIRSLKDDPIAYPKTLFMQALFGDHSYARPAIGTQSGIEMLTGVQLRQWFRDNMRKILPTIVIVGDSSGTALVAPIADALTNEDLQAKDLAALPRVQPTAKSSQVTETSSWEETVFVYGFPGVNRSSNDRYAFDLLTNTLRGSVQGVFPLEVVNESNARGGAIYTSTGFSPDKEDEVRAMLDAEHTRLRQQGVSPEALRGAIQYSIGTYAAAFQARQSRVLEYARAVYGGGGVQSVAGYGAAMEKVTAAQLESVVERYLDPSALRTAIVRRRAQ